ncbi:MAG TPA: hypothetical protein VM077_04640 [Candidatus Limnocylindrales bacterium]|nr:hypothetical protein [Candidatus Limnocylindrales bacterium]
MAEKIKSINLLPNKNGGFVDQFLGWALTIGRLLIILTETLALGTFIYRFSIDMKIIDLHDNIKYNSTIVQQYQKEQAFRDIQTRLALTETYGNKNNNASLILSDIIEMGRAKITFKKLVISSGTVKIEAQAPNGNALTLFVNTLKNYPGIVSVSIGSIETKTSSSLINADITARIEQLGTKL